MLLPNSFGELGGDIATAKQQLISITCVIHDDRELRLCVSNQISSYLHLAAILRGLVNRGHHVPGLTVAP